ncbi:N-acetylmuramidase domain-containing protein [Bacteroides rodentium]
MQSYSILITDIFARFIRKVTPFPTLQNKSRTEFAERYNGAAFAQNGYVTKPVSACLELKTGL